MFTSIEKRLLTSENGEHNITLQYHLIILYNSVLLNPRSFVFRLLVISPPTIKQVLYLEVTNDIITFVCQDY